MHRPFVVIEEVPSDFDPDNPWFFAFDESSFRFRTLEDAELFCISKEMDYELKVVARL